MLRDYQTDSLARLKAAAAGMSKPRRAILQGETGSGKTVQAVALLDGCFRKGKSALFVVRGRNLVDQCSRQLQKWGVPHGVIMSGRGMTKDKIQVVSKDTFISWVLKRKKLPLPNSDLLILDECHESISKGWLAIMAAYPDAVVVGLSATPVRADGRSLYPTYKAMVESIPSSELVRQGWLVPTRVFAPYRPDLKGVPKDKNGDWNKTALAKRLNKTRLVGRVVDHWLALGKGRPTIAFNCTRAHAMAVRDEFVKKGVSCAYLDGNTKDNDRDKILAGLADGSISVVSSVAVLTQGVDVPPASCAIMNRPTRSFRLFRQCCGRIKRPYPGKADCLLLDHAGAVYLHGMPDDDVDWRLEENQCMEDKLAKLREGEPPERQLVCCAKCHCMYRGAEQCPNCGHKAEKKTQKTEITNGKLVEVGGENFRAHGLEQRVRFWHYCLGSCAWRKRSAATAGHIYHQRYHAWPWEESGLPNIPDRRDWQKRVCDLYPQYLDSAKKVMSGRK